MLDPILSRWLDVQAQALDVGSCDPQEVLPRLAEANILRIGVPTHLGGLGGDVAGAVEAIANVASHSLAAAFVCWGQRSFIEYLLQSPNQRLREQLMPDLLSGKLAGATGLSNAMKFLSGIETLQISAEPNDHGWILNGRLHWVTNLRKNGFVAAAAIEHAGAARHLSWPFRIRWPGCSAPVTWSCSGCNRATPQRWAWKAWS